MSTTPASTRSRRRARWLAAALALGALPASPQREEAIPSPLVFREEVRFVTLDVLVLRKGPDGWGPARDLRAEQLRVQVGDADMELELFENWCGGAAGAGELATLDSESSPASGRGIAIGDLPVLEGAATDEEAAGPQVPPVRYILFFDYTHLKLDGYRLAFKAARKWVEEQVLPHDEVMIVTGDIGLRIVRPMTPASVGLREDLEVAFKGFLSTEAWAEWEGDSNRGRIGDIVRAPTYPSRESMANSYAKLDSAKTRRTLTNMRDLMTLFGTVEGTKNLVFFEDTVRFFPGSGYPYVSDLSPVDAELSQLAVAANERDVRIYPVNAGGAGSGVDDALTFLASETGGRWTSNTNDLGTVFEHVAEDMSCFYRLGFRIPSRYSGTIERIHVEVLDDRKYRLRHRRTLADPTAEERDRDNLRAAFLDPTAAGDFPIRASVVPLFSHQGGTRVRVQVSVSLQEILDLPSPQGPEGSRQARVQIGGTVLPLRNDGPPGSSGSGILGDVETNRRPWEFAQQAIMTLQERRSSAGRDLVLTEDIDAPSGTYRLVAVVQDRLANAIAARTMEFDLTGEPEALGDIHLAVIDPGAIYMDGPEQAAEDHPEEGKRKKKRMTAAARVLPGAARVLEELTLDPARAGHLVYGICDLEKAGKKRRRKNKDQEPTPPFHEWEVHRFLRCDGGTVPLALDARRIPAPEPDERCALVLETLPAGTMDPGECRYEVTVKAPEEPPLVRSLTFRVEPPAVESSPPTL